jgi:hypothetical protein
MENAAAVKQRRFHFGLERREVEKRIYKEGWRLTASAALHVYRLNLIFEWVIAVL